MNNVFLALALTVSQAHAQAKDELCRLTGQSSGCIGTVERGDSSGSREPREPRCDDDCRREAAAAERYAREHIPEPDAVARVDSVSMREERTVKSAIKGDDRQDRVLLASTLALGARLPNPWLAFGLLAGALIVQSPSLDLQRHVQAIWMSNPGSYIPPPRGAPRAFPNLRTVKRKNDRKRWEDEDGNIWEWDGQHGRVEKYNRRGKHLGEYDPNTGEQTKPAEPGRRTET